MKKWEQIEEYLFERHLLGETFTCADVAATFDVPTGEASRMIQAYLDAQTSESSSALFALHRTGRTSSTVWHIGVRAADASGLARQTIEDMQRRYERFVTPTLEQITARNPQASRRAEGIAKAMEGGMILMASMLAGD